MIAVMNDRLMTLWNTAMSDQADQLEYCKDLDPSGFGMGLGFSQLFY